MGNRYSFTEEALANLHVYGISPGQVWVALHSRPRLSRQIGAEGFAIFAVTPSGDHLMVLVVESTADDTDWGIVAARHMTHDEAVAFDRHTGRTQ